MADQFTKEERSELMSRIRSQDTGPELLVRRYLHGRGLRFRLHAKKLPGRPDIVLKRFSTVILVQGCFWHGHEGCRHFSLPKTRIEFWQAKIAANQARDTINSFRLARLGWRVLTVWECELSPKVRKDTLERLQRRLLDPSGLPAKPKKRQHSTLERTIKFAPGTGGDARKRHLGQVVRETGRPVVDIFLLKKGLPPLRYGERDIVLADSARICFAESIDSAFPKGTLLCTGCGLPLEECVWEAQDGLCSRCWSQAA